jgi:hypothetical protein
MKTIWPRMCVVLAVFCLAGSLQAGIQPFERGLMIDLRRQRQLAPAL